MLGTVRLPPENLAKAQSAMADMIAASRAEEGCAEYSYAEDLLQPGLIHVKELWRDQLALDKHFASDHIKAWRAAWPELGICERKLRAYEVGEPRTL